MPGEIAIKRHIQSYITGAFKDMIQSDEQRDLFMKLKGFSKNKDFIIKGEELQKLKKELTPVISRKAFLMSASQRFMSMTLKQAKDLLNYYKSQK